MTPKVTSLDHLVLTVTDIMRTVEFYSRVLGMTPERFTPSDGSKRWALKFGDQKVNLHLQGAEFDPKAAQVQAGSADLCFLSDTPLAEWIAHLARDGVAVEAGPLPRTGATGSILSLYLRDPDGNLIEIANRV